METPPPPSLSTGGNNPNNVTQKRSALDRTAKTPFQSGSSFYQRSFKSEIQPNRTVARFDGDATNARSNTRFYPSTSLRPAAAHQPNTEGKPVERKNGILSRLAHLGAKQAPSVLKQDPQPPSRKVDKNEVNSKLAPANILADLRRSQALTTTTPGLPLKIQSRLQPQILNPPMTHQKSIPQVQLNNQQLHPPQQKEQKDVLYQSIPKTHTPYHQPQPSTKPHLHLIQDTRGANQQVGLATATKAPLSVSQYTQPTPLPANKSQQMHRAHSEPSIKYQVVVNDKTYKILRRIGLGGSAKVYEGFEPQTSQTVAIKIINVAKADQKTQESYFNEKALLYRLRDSKHVVRMYDSEYKADCKELVIVMEKGDADLSQVIDSYFKTKDKVIDGIFIKFYWRGMLKAVRDIHHQGIVHADLKPVNFILVKNEIKLIDFGIASAVDPEETSIIRDYQIGTINYMAPETLRNRAADASFQYLNLQNDDENNQQKRTVIKYNSKIDIWSLGCILYNLVYGRPPFDSYKDVSTKMQAITNPRHIISFPEVSNKNLLDCMKSCLKYNPNDRPTAQELLEHPYLKEDIITRVPS